ncbi:hypothetical protein [Novosphingobium sp. Rr 2-17]|uniref:hypothetical protein n=1 Tax=Novosphingobium sp. Rr 2-17 TaxID=555793 RepID=UPI0002F5337C|nr:hypothetical protein [Novosphingobium sp. Rr 2-17]
MILPIERGGFQVATSGGTSSGLPTEIVYPKDELADTYQWAGGFIGRHIIDRHMPSDHARWVACTLADHMMWSSASMVGGVLQAIPDINYIGAGAIDHEVFQRILAYPGTKAVMGISRSIADLVAFADRASANDRASLRVALYGSGALQPKVHADLRNAYPNLVVLSFFAAMQAETIGLQLDPASPVLTAVPGLHLVEIVDAENRSVAVGEEGDLLVTRLFGNGAPVLRYRLGDRMVRRSDLVSDRLNAMRFEYAGRSSDRFELGGSYFYAPKVLASIGKALRRCRLLDLDQVAQDVQIRVDRAHRRMTILVVTVRAEELSRTIDAQIAAAIIRQVMVTAKTERDGPLDGFRFAIALVPPGSQELVTTGVGKTPLLVERD